MTHYTGRYIIRDIMKRYISLVRVYFYHLFNDMMKLKIPSIFLEKMFKQYSYEINFCLLIIVSTQFYFIWHFRSRPIEYDAVFILACTL